MIQLFNTYISPDAASGVKKVLNSTFVSEGEAVKEFEQALKDKFGFRYISTLNSGTAALHLALDAAGVKEGDEVIIPAQTFIATGLAVLYLKAKPVFADICYEDGNIDPKDVERKITSKTKAVMCVHWGGYPCNMQALREICDKHNLILIEDAAHALGAKYKDEAIGNISDLTCFSFQAIKHLTTGDGGAISCTDPKLFEKILEKRWFGINRATAALSELGERQYDVSEAGYKYHLNNYAAALGLANLRGYEKRMASRKAIADHYTTELKNIKGIKLFSLENDRENAWWLFGFHVENRLDFISHLKENGIAASVVHQRIDRNSVFGGLKDLPQQKQFDETQIHIPLHDGITSETATFITDIIKKGWS